MATASATKAASGYRNLEPVLDWSNLARKDEVELMGRGGKILAMGQVDMRALDGSVFWLIQDEGKGRAMFLPSDDYVVLRHRRPGTARRTGR